jgi:chromosome segregation ATPase
LTAVNPADLLEIDLAAEAFGVSTETLLRRLDGGGLPEAVKRDGSWTVPTDALAAIAEREGWRLDLTSDGRGRAAAVPEHLDRYIQGTNAANAAVVLAKTQATAARAEARDLARRLRQTDDELGCERAERERVARELSEVARAQAVLERDLAVAEARADELRRQLEQERVERSLLSGRIGVVEADREEAVAAMGWWSRRRYHRRRAGDGPVGNRATATTQKKLQK